MSQIVVLGAGMAGLTAARALADEGHGVTVIDKGRGIGGRLATRRIGDAVLDHGAQFFTTRGERFVELVAQAVESGVVTEWCRGFGAEDGYPRYRGEGGMTALAKWIGRDLDVRSSAQAHRIEVNDAAVSFVDEAGLVLAQGDHAVVTAPIPQMLALFDNGGVKLGHEVAHKLKSVEYFATLALLAVVDGEPNIAAPGGMQFDGGPFTFIADNKQKGISPASALTFHAAHDWSKRRYDDDPTDVHRELLEMAGPWIGDATVVESQLKKWRYAGPVTPLPETTLVVEAGPVRIALAGDAFGGPKVEGAFNSGVAAAQTLGAMIG